MVIRTKREGELFPILLCFILFVYLESVKIGEKGTEEGRKLNLV